MRKVIITGATSMIGNALLHECIKNNVEVLVIIRPDSKNSNRIPYSPFIHICECDLKDLSIFDFTQYGSDWDVFYHFAWNYTTSKYRNDVIHQNLNIGYTLETLKIAKHLGCSKYVGAGSQAEYGFLNTDKIAPESPTDPVTAYGIAKYSAGKMTALLANQNDINFLWTRIFSVYGKYDLPTTMISSSIIKMLNGERTAFTSGIQLWDYLYSSDAGRAFYLIGEKSTGNKVYCLGSGKSRPLYEYIEIMKNVINPNLEIGIGDIPYNGKTIMNLCADISSLQKDTGFITEIGFKDGINMIINNI